MANLVEQVRVELNNALKNGYDMLSIYSNDDVVASDMMDCIDGFEDKNFDEVKTAIAQVRKEGLTK